MAAVAPYSLERLQVIKQIGVDHLVYYDMATMPVEYDELAVVVKQAGYGFLGPVYATGYLRGLLESVFGKPGLDRWKPIPAERRSAGYPFPA